jgi:hypothetical protein
MPLDPVTLTASFQELVFDFTDSPIPANSTDLFLTVVYKARLGLEDGAVMVGGKDLFESDPFDVGNATDWECAEGELYHVADLTAYPPYLPPSARADPARPDQGRRPGSLRPGGRIQCLRQDLRSQPDLAGSFREQLRPVHRAAVLP